MTFSTLSMSDRTGPDREGGGIEPLHVTMPQELKSCPSISQTHPGNEKDAIKFPRDAESAGEDTLNPSLSFGRLTTQHIAAERPSVASVLSDVLLVFLCVCERLSVA